MSSKKYHKTETGFEKEIEVKPVNYDVKASMVELVRMFELLAIKFENHIELAKKEDKVSVSLNGIYQSFLKTHKNLEKLNA